VAHIVGTCSIFEGGESSIDFRGKVKSTNSTIQGLIRIFSGKLDEPTRIPIDLES
jgi:hypothetical protein